MSNLHVIDHPLITHKLSIMRNRKNIHFVPMAMDDPENKPHSLVADFGRIGEVIDKL